MDASSLQVSLPILGGFLVVAGSFLCFFGHQLLRTALGLAGFCIGFMVGSRLGLALQPGASMAGLIGGVVGGIVVAALLAAILVVGVTLLGAILGGLLSTMVYRTWGPFPLPFPATVAIGAAMGAILALAMRKPMAAVITALAGAWIAGVGLLFILGRLSDLPSLPAARTFHHTAFGSPLNLGLWVGVAALGTVIQIRRQRR